MNMKGDDRDFKGGMLCLPGPNELEVQVRIVLIGLCAAILIGIGGDQAHGRVIASLLILVVVLLYLLGIRLSGAWHLDHLDYHEDVRDKVTLAFNCCYLSYARIVKKYFNPLNMKPKGQESH